MLNVMRISLCAVIALMHGHVQAQEITDPAADQKIGEVLSSVGDQGEVLLQRSGASLPVSDGIVLMDGDKIVTGQGGSVKVVAHGCERTLEPLSMIVVNSDFCRAGVKSLQTNGENGSQLARARNTIASIPPAGTAAIAAVTLGGVLVVADDDGKTNPISR